MTHLLDQDMVRLAIEVDTDNQLEGDDLELANHIFSCNECQNKFAFCMNSLKLLKPDSLEKYFSNIFQNSIEEVSSFQDLQETILCKTRIVIGHVKEKVKCITDFMAEGLPQFHVADSYAYARGNGSDEVEVIADESIIVYSKENECLTISLDEEVYGEKNLLVYIEIDGEKRQSKFVSDGRGMLEATFEDVKKPEKIEISIVNLI